MKKRNQSNLTPSSLPPLILFAASILIVMFAWSGNVWAEIEQKNKDIDQQETTSNKQDNLYTTTGMQTQAKKEQLTVMQKDVQTKQDESNKNKYSSVTDELVCGDATVIYTHNGDIRNQWYLGEPKLFIKENQKELDSSRGYVVEWGCVTNKYDKYKKAIAINFYSGGNCMSCEWTDIYDLKGRLLMSDSFELQGTDAKYYLCAEQYMKYITGFSASWVEDSCKKEANEKRFQKIKNMVKNNLAVSKKIKNLLDKKMYSPTSLAN
jgi:hypothetical protein